VTAPASSYQLAGHIQAGTRRHQAAALTATVALAISAGPADAIERLQASDDPSAPEAVTLIEAELTAAGDAAGTAKWQGDRGEQ
jgi:predicted protein tyrosine phosphatase